MTATAAVTTITKRDGRQVPYNISKIEEAIVKAMEACGREEPEECSRLAVAVEAKMNERFPSGSPTVEDIQDIVEVVLMENGYAFVARKYILYRSERTKQREMNTNLMRIFNEINTLDSSESDLKRDNANVDGDTAMGTMLKYGSEGAKDYYMKCILTEQQAQAHKNGDIHIHDMDFYTLTTTCCQIDLIKLFSGGFSTGHGYLREPNDIQSYAALACIAIQSNQNDQHGGQSIGNFDYGLAPGVKKSYRKIYIANFAKAAELLAPECGITFDEVKKKHKALFESKAICPSIENDEAFTEEENSMFPSLSEEKLLKIRDFAKRTSAYEIDRATFQAMEALVHNLNTMHSRAGAQTPFSSINYGMDTTPEGRLIIKNILLATEQGLGFGETAIFPIHVFRVKEGINYEKTDPNYDLFKLAMQVSAKRLFPNFSFLDAPYNLQYYKPGCPESEISYMGCRTRVMGNVYDRSKEISFGRGNLSFTSINLPRLAINNMGNVERFFDDLEHKLELVYGQLYDRYKIQASKKVRNYPFLMGQGIWEGSDSLGLDDTVGEILKHGTLSIGFIGLAETLTALIGSHHGQTKEARTLGLEIVSFMRDFCDRKSKETKMNVTLLATPAEGLSGRFVRMDKEKYGIIKGVTDKDYYTNSFHIPVGFQISAYDKIITEAPYHALTNAGHISYVELDGDTSNNIEAFESIIRTMHDAGIGYGSVNHPVDRDPECGYSGIINDACPKCGRREEEHSQRFERIRRITGYLVGTLDRFNDAKRAEERDRVKHSL